MAQKKRIKSMVEQEKLFNLPKISGFFLVGTYRSL